MRVAAGKQLGLEGAWLDEQNAAVEGLKFDREGL